MSDLRRAVGGTDPSRRRILSVIPEVDLMAEGPRVSVGLSLRFSNSGIRTSAKLHDKKQLHFLSDA